MSIVLTVFFYEIFVFFLEIFFWLWYTEKATLKRRVETMSDKVKVIKIVTISTIIFIFLLAVSLIINLIKIGGLNKQARELETQKNAMLAQIEENDEKIDYMSSDLYVDQFARENLGYIGAGEELFVGK